MVLPALFRLLHHGKTQLSRKPHLYTTPPFGDNLIKTEFAGQPFVIPQAHAIRIRREIREGPSCRAASLILSAVLLEPLQAAHVGQVLDGEILK